MLIICIVCCIKTQGILLVTKVMNSKQVEILNAKCTCNNEDRMKKMDISELLCAILGTKFNKSFTFFFYYIPGSNQDHRPDIL